MRSLGLAVLLWVGMAGTAAAGDDPLDGLPPAFQPRAGEAVFDPDAVPLPAPATTRVWVRAGRPGRLELLDPGGGLLVADEGPSPAVFYAWGHALKDVPDRGFQLRFVPTEALPGTQRVLRVRASSDRLVTLEVDDGDRWQLRDAAEADFGLTPDALLALVSPTPGVGAGAMDDAIDLDALDRELEALLALEVDPAAAAAPDSADALREAGMQRMAEGDYAGALEAFEQSLALRPDPALADRAARLRVYLGLARMPQQGAQ